MQASESQVFNILPYLAWGFIALAGIVYWVSKRPPRLVSVPLNGEVLDVPSHLINTEASTVLVERKESDGSTLLVADVLKSKMRRGRRTLHHPALVDFDPCKADHCEALQMLMQDPARLHPTLRFHFDPSVHDNAYAFMLSELAHQHIDRVLKPKKVKKAYVPKPKSTKTEVVAFRPIASRINNIQ